MGFRIMIFSFATLAPAYLAIKETLTRLKTQGIVGTPKNITPVTLFEVCGLKHSSKSRENLQVQYREPANTLFSGGGYECWWHVV